MHEGHRKRIMERLISGGDTLQDHELLEILLFNALPRRNTNPIAHSLLKAFGSFSGVIHASVQQLTEVEGVGPSTAEYLRCIGLVFDKVNPKTDDLPRCSSVQELSGYLEGHFRNLTEEHLEIYCLDKSEKIYFCKSFSVGSERKVSVEPNEISRIFVTQKPYAVIAAHNHPNCSNNPSKEDDCFTASLFVLCSLNNVKLHDHYIYGKEGYFSYYLTGRLDTIKRKCNLNSMLDGNLLL